MKIIKETKKSVDLAVADLTASIVKHKFGVLHVHNIYETLNDKGVNFTNQCQVLEVCNPVFADIVLKEDMDLNLALPCRISVFEKAGKNYIGMLSPVAMLSQFALESDILTTVAQSVEDALLGAIAEAL